MSSSNSTSPPARTDSSSSSRNTKIESPMEIRSPCCSQVSFTETPLTRVPLRLSRSRILKRSPSDVITQWRRDKEGSLTENALPGSRPIVDSTAVIAKLESLLGPTITESLGITSATSSYDVRRLRQPRSDLQEIARVIAIQ